MLSRFYRKTGSILGLLAILMATLAPTISQAIAASRGADEAALCPMHSMHSMQGMHEMPMSMKPMQGGVMHDHDASADSHSLASHWDQCGYCSLLAHFPALTATPTLFALTVAVITQRIATRFESVALIAPFEPAQPRAPPVSL
jgi:hypothetical protein